MTTSAPIPPTTGTVTVALPPKRALVVFTGSINQWWPDQYHIGQAEVAEVVPESHEGGRWYERGVDDSECVRVEVEHRLFERLVGGEAISGAIRGGGGWAQLLDGFAKVAAEQS